MIHTPLSPPIPFFLIIIIFIFLKSRFSTRTIAEQRGEEEAKEATREKKELEIVRRMLQKRREEIEVIREEQGERRVQRGKRVEKLKAEHAKAAKARGIELKTAKKMMAKNQFKAFERV